MVDIPIWQVHERSLDSDFLLIVLRDALSANPNLKIILMSATVNAARFAEYFASPSAAITLPPAVRRLAIPGRTFPIDDFFLEDAVETTGYVARGKMLLRGEEAEEELAPLMQAQAELSDKGGEEGGEEGEGAESAEESRRVWHLLCEAGFQGKDSERIKIYQMPPLSWLL